MLFYIYTGVPSIAFYTARPLPQFDVRLSPVFSSFYLHPRNFIWIFTHFKRFFFFNTLSILESDVNHHLSESGLFLLLPEPRHFSAIHITTPTTRNHNLAADPLVLDTQRSEYWGKKERQRSHNHRMQLRPTSVNFNIMSRVLVTETGFGLVIGFISRLQLQTVTHNYL
jgi:hypothetical protein